MEKNVIEKFLNIIDNLHSEDPLVDYLADFVASYDGTNTEEFKMLVLGTVRYILQTSELEVKARAFDKLISLEEKGDKQLDVISEEMGVLLNPVEPANPPKDFVKSKS